MFYPTIEYTYEQVCAEGGAKGARPPAPLPLRSTVPFSPGVIDVAVVVLFNSFVKLKVIVFWLFC